MEVPVVGSRRRSAPAAPPARTSCTAAGTPTGGRSGARRRTSARTRSRAASSARSPSRPVPWWRARTWTSSGQREANGMAATKCSLAWMTRSLARSSAISRQPRQSPWSRRWLVVAGQLGGDHRREMAVGVELAVEVGERGADVAAVVLEGHHVVVALRPQRRRALAPDGDDVGELLQRQVGEVLDVLGRCRRPRGSARATTRTRSASASSRRRGRAATSTGSGSRTRPARTGRAAPGRPGTAGTAGRPRRWSSCSGARCGPATRGPRRR